MNHPVLYPELATALRSELVRTVAHPTATRRPGRRVAYAAVGLVAALGGASLLTPGAYAEWTPIPQELDPEQSMVVAQACIDQHAELSRQAVPNSPDPRLWNVELVERRGDWDFVLLSTNTGYLGDCLTSKRGGMAGSGKMAAVKPGQDSITLVGERAHALDTSLWESGPKSEGHYILYGRVDSDVDSVVLHSQRAGDVTATIDNGFWLAWWPISNIGVRLNFDDDPVLGATLTTTDGRVTEMNQTEWTELREQ